MVAQSDAYARTITPLDGFLARGPNAGSQTKFFHSPYPQIIYSAGNKVGKTFSNVTKGALRSIPEKDIHGNNTGWLLDPYVRRRLPRRQIQGWFSTYSQPVQERTLQPTVDEIFASGSDRFIKNSYKEKGCYHWIETEVAHIHFVWQTAEDQSYTGANLDWIGADEPHARKLWNEMLSRFARTEGCIWITMTPVIDASDPDIARKMRYIRWMKDDLIDPWHKDPKTRPELDVIYGDIEENPHVNAERQLRMWAGLTQEELLIRKTGQFFDFIGETAFDADQLNMLQTYLRENPDISQPRYGYLEHDERETSDEWKIRFVETTDNFPTEPASGWIWRIWEEPIDPQMNIATMP